MDNDKGPLFLNMMIGFTYICNHLLITFYQVLIFRLFTCLKGSPTGLVLDVPDTTYDDFYVLNTNNNSNDPTLDTLVVNLSAHTLTVDEISVLNRGMKFFPTPGEPNFGELREDLNNFHTRLRRQLFFSSLPEERDEEGGIDPHKPEMIRIRDLDILNLKNHRNGNPCQ